MDKVTAYVSHSDCSRHDTGWGHPEHQGRLPSVARAVYRDMLTLFEPLLELEGEPATADDLGLVHTAEYLGRVQQRVAEAAERGEVLELEAGVRVSGASWDAARAAAGCALTAVEAVLAATVRNAFCAVRPPGHGAGPDFAGGFGLVNPVAVAARHLVSRRAVPRVLVVEWGARGGSGTAAALRGVEGTRLVSVHQQGMAGPAAAWRGAFATALPAGADVAAVGGALARALDAATRDFPPDFVLLSLGCDALAADPLGGLELQPHDFHLLTGELRARADSLCEGRLVTVLEDGYAPDAMAGAVVQHLRALAGLHAA